MIDITYFGVLLFANLIFYILNKLFYVAKTISVIRSSQLFWNLLCCKF